MDTINKQLEFVMKVINDCGSGNGENNITISFDNNGNVYATYLDKVYQLCVREDTPYFDEGDYSIINTEQKKTDKLVQFREGKMSHKKLVEMFHDDSDEEEPNYFSEDDDYATLSNPEKEKREIKKATSIIDIKIEEEMNTKYAHKFDLTEGALDDDIFEDEPEPTVKFYDVKKESIPIHTRTNGDILSLYDTIIYNGSPDMGVVVFKSTITGDETPYRCMIYSNGILQFKIIGDHKICNYCVHINSEANIMLVKQI